MVEIQIEYQGELRCRAVHGPSGCEVITDAPTDNQGKGESFSPTDLEATALATCMLTIMGIAASKGGWDIAGTTCRIEKGMVADPKRRIGSLLAHIHVPVELDPEARATLEQAARECPVNLSVHPDIDRPVTFTWGTRGAD